MSLKPFHFSLVLLALTPVFRADAEEMLLAQATKVAVPSRPTKSPIVRAHISTNTAPTTPSGVARPVPTLPAPGAPIGFPQTTPPGFPAAATPAAVPGAPGASAPAVLPGIAMQPGATVNPDDVPSFDYNFIATPVDQILDEYADLVNRTILRANNGPSLVAPGTLITLRTRAGHKLTRHEAIMALEAVLGMNGVTVVPVGEKFLKVVPDAVAGTQGAAFNTTASANLPELGRFITQIVQVKYAGQDIAQALTPFSRSPNSIVFIPSTQTLVLRDYAENVKRMMEIVEKIDVSSPMEVKPEVIAIKYALASDIANALSSLSGGGGGTVSVGSHQSGGGLGGGRFGGSGSGGIGSGGTGGNSGIPGQPGYGNTGAQGTSGLASPGTTTRSSFQNNLARIIKNAASASGGPGGGEFQILGQTKIIADERTNSLLIFANDDDMKMIKLIVGKLDVVLAQVLIEAIIVDVALTKNRNVGVSYLTSRRVGNGTVAFGNNNLSGAAKSFLTGTGTTTVGSNTVPISGLTTLPSGLSAIGTFGNFDVAVEAIESDSRATILSRPRIQTSHAVPAVLFNGQTIPYITGTSYGGYTGGLGSSQYTQKEVGISLEVLPLINPDGLVVMDIRQNIEEVSGTTKIDQNDVPITSKRQAEAKVAVRDRETIILGGFIRSTKSKSSSGVPFLKDIPGIGVLFRCSNNSSDQDELIVLIRPTVLPTPEIASKFATEERNRLSGVKQGERDLRIEEEERYRRIEHELKKDDEIRKAREERDAKQKNRQKVSTEHYQYENGASYMTNKPVTTPDL
ncbi:MAG: Type and secretion system protein [Verrucomicrobiales bacterium]|nr:Type and secretion system protein [Verrucomicrobiales bacterium]